LSLSTLHLPGVLTKQYSSKTGYTCSEGNTPHWINSIITGEWREERGGERRREEEERRGEEEGRGGEKERRGKGRGEERCG
jgi:hypothetical protein